MIGARLFLIALLAFACRQERSGGPERTPATIPPPIAPARSPTAKPVAAPDAGAAPALSAPVRAEAPERDPAAPKVRLTLTVLPVDAEVVWGRKRLGVAGRKPLEVERPRNSGPLDVVIRASGFLPYHTRLFTDRDDTLTVRLVRPADARALPGWKPTPRSGSAPAAR